MSAQILGLGVMAATALLIAFVLFGRRHRALFLFAIALGAVGLGYLATTPAPAEVIEAIFGAQPWIDYGTLANG